VNNYFGDEEERQGIEKEAARTSRAIQITGAKDAEEPGGNRGLGFDLGSEGAGESKRNNCTYPIDLNPWILGKIDVNREVC